MSDLKFRHITEHDFAELMMGASVSPEVQDHVANCDTCREELTAFSGAVGDFSSASLRWIEKRPAASLRQAERDRARRTRQLRYGWAVSVATAVLVAVPLWTHLRPDSPATRDRVVALQPKTAEATEAQIARDNELMKSVDVALSDTDASPLRQFGIATDSEGPGRNQGELRNE